MVAGPRTYLPSETGRHPASVHPDILMLNDRAQISKTSPTKQPPSANFTHRDVLANPILALSKNVQMAAEIDLLLLCPSEILALKHESRILGQWSNPVSGARKSQSSSLWDTQHRA